MTHNLPITKAFQHVGNLLYGVFKWPTDKVIRWAEASGDGYASRFVQSKRPLYIMGGITCGIFGTGFYRLAIKQYDLGSKVNANSNEKDASVTGKMMAQLSNLNEDSAILPRLDGALANALKYAQNGNIAVMSEYLSTVEEIVLEYPRYKQYIAWKSQNGVSGQSPNSSKIDSAKAKAISEMAQTVVNQNKEYLSQMQEKVIEMGSQIQETIDDKLNLNLEKQMMPMVASLSPQTESNSNIDKKGFEKRKSKLESKEQTVTSEDCFGKIVTISEIESQMEFRNQIDYINYVGISQRCNMLYNRAKRQAIRGNVVDCATLLSQIWEMIENHSHKIYIPYYDSNNSKNSKSEIIENLELKNPIIDSNSFDGNKKMVELNTNDLLKIMRDAHIEYINYMINETKNIGNRDEDRLLMRRNAQIGGKKLLTAVYQNIENIKHYSKRYCIYDDSIKQQLKSIWAQKEALLTN